MDTIRDKLRESVNRRPVANGLAIIIDNENSSDPSHGPLDGPRRNLENMKETFEVLRFATLPILNASKEQVLATVRAAASYKKYPPSYKRIAFVFSGHGDENVIYAHDGAVETNQVYEPLQPKNAPHLADIPKLFFIDACRGTIDDKGIVARGKIVLPRKPSYGNYILAYSTMPSMQAYGSEEGGGLWMNTVSKELRTSRKSVLNALTDVNGELLKEFRRRHYTSCQQPVLESTVHETVRLREEAEELGKQQEVQLSFPPYSEDQEIIDGRQVHPSSWLPPHSTHQLSSHTLPVAHSAMKPLAPVFMGTTPLEQQWSTQQHYQRPQQLSMCPTVPGSRPPTHAVTSQPHHETEVPTAHVATIGVNSHLQTQTIHGTVTSTTSSSPFLVTTTSASVIPSTATQKSNVVDEGHPHGVGALVDVSEYLIHLKKDQTFRLALVLGLHAVPTLDKIRDTPNFLYDMLAAWLLGQDDVNKRGGHTWGALANALQHPSVAQNEIADRIQREKCYRD